MLVAFFLLYIDLFDCVGYLFLVQDFLIHYPKVVVFV